MTEDRTVTAHLPERLAIALTKPWYLIKKPDADEIRRLIRTALETSPSPENRQ